MDAILYIQAAKEEFADKLADEAIIEANKASFRPPHPSHAQIDLEDAIDQMYDTSDTLVGGMTGDKDKGLVNAQKKWNSTAQQDWDDAIAPV